MKLPRHLAKLARPGGPSVEPGQVHRPRPVAGEHRPERPWGPGPRRRHRQTGKG